MSSKEQASINFMAAITICSDLGAQKTKVSHCFHCFPIYFHEVMGPDAVVLVFWMLSFKPTFSISSFTFIKRLFNSYLHFTRRVLSSVYLMLLIFIPVFFIPAWSTFSQAFLMIYSAYTLNNQGDSIQPWGTSFPISCL